MKLGSSSIFSVALLLGATFVATPAFADDADKAACASLDEGDDCTDGDGQAGTCIPDESDASVLTCDNDASSGSGGSDGSGGSGCSTTGDGGEAPFGGLLVGLAAVAISRLRRSNLRAV